VPIATGQLFCEKVNVNSLTSIASLLPCCSCGDTRWKRAAQEDVQVRSIFDIPASCSITASVVRARAHAHTHAHTLHAGVNTNSRAHDCIQTTTHTTETTRTRAQSRKLLQRSALWRVQLATWWRATVDLVCCFPSSTTFFLARQRCRRCHSDCRTTHAAVPKERRKRVWRAKEVVVEAKQQAFHHAGCTDTSALPRLLFVHSTLL
jgi:hypothetical protein